MGWEFFTADETAHWVCSQTRRRHRPFRGDGAGRRWY